jgi:hypothetical protein
MLRTKRFVTAIGLSGGAMIGYRGQSAGIGRRARAGIAALSLLLAAVLGLTAGARPAAAASEISWLCELGYVSAGSWDCSKPNWFPPRVTEDYLDVRIAYGAVDPNYIQIVLQTPSWITWLKGIEIEEAVPAVAGCTWFFGTEICGPTTEYRLITAVYTRDYYHGPYSVFVPVSQLRDNGAGPGRLRFGKAKMFGVYTGMYEIYTTNVATDYRCCIFFVPGARYTFTWMDD